MKMALRNFFTCVYALCCDALGNLWAGFKLFLCLRTERKDFAVSGAYFWCIAAIVLFTYSVADYFYIEHPDHYSYYAWEDIAFYICGLFFAAFFASRITQQTEVQLALPIIALNALWVPIIVDYAISAAFRHYGEKTHYHLYLYCKYFILFWVALRGLTLLTPASMLRRVGAALVVVALGFGVNENFHANYLWYKNYEEKEEQEAKAPVIMPEDALSDQYQLLDAQLAKIEPRKKGKNYFVITYGSEDEQNVFMKEAIYARRVFEKKFNAAGHIITLINNQAMLAQLPSTPVKSLSDMFSYMARKTAVDAVKNTSEPAAHYPLATVSNLKRALQAISKKANMNEDVLILYITSHGGKNNIISVGLSGVDLYQLTGDKLKEMLKESGFKWKVLLISACFSGSFVDKLKDDTTIIVTSSREDRFSYGCGMDDELTYFGDAFLREALGKTDSFITAYELARESVEHHEEDAHITRHSQPQLYVGRDAKHYLK